MRLILVLTSLAGLLFGQSGTQHIKSATTSYEAGENFAKEKKYEQATEQFRKAIEIEPTYEDAFEGLVAACLSAGRRPDAAAAMTELLEIEPGLVRYRLLLGQILLEQNQPERALAQYSLVLKGKPLDADGLLGFAAAAKRLGMNDRAAEALERGRKQYPQDKRFEQTAP